MADIIDNRYLAFSLGQQSFAVPLLQVREVIAPTTVTPVPKAPGYFLGLLNLRGQVISVMNLAQKLGIKQREVAEPAIIICNLEPILLGVLVDSVDRVLNADPEGIKPCPPADTGLQAEFIEAVYREADEIVLFLRLAKALNVEDLVAMEKHQSHHAA